MKEKKQELSEKLIKKASRTHRHLLRQIKAEEAEEEIKEYATQPIQDSVCGNNLPE